MSALSPAAQAVLDEYSAAADFTFDPSIDFFGVKAGLAAALRAAVDQVVPSDPCGNDCCITQCEQIRARFLAIAAELAGGTTIPDES